MRNFEPYGIDEELLLDRDKRIEKEPRLRPDICECWRCGAQEIARYRPLWRCEEAITDRLIGLLGVSRVEGIWRIGSCVEMYEVLPSSVSVVVVNINMRSVDGELLEVWSTVAVELGIEI